MTEYVDIALSDLLIFKEHLFLNTRVNLNPNPNVSVSKMQLPAIQNVNKLFAKLC